MTDLKKYLEDVPWDSSLKLSDGKTIHNLEQLPVVLMFCDDSVFDSHVNSQKNDFANWIRDVVGYTELADKIAGVKNKEEFLKIMEQSINELKSGTENVTLSTSSQETSPVEIVSAINSDVTSVNSTKTVSATQVTSQNISQTTLQTTSQTPTEVKTDVKTEVQAEIKTDFQSPVAQQSIPVIEQSVQQSPPVIQQSTQQEVQPVQAVETPVLVSEKSEVSEAVVPVTTPVVETVVAPNVPSAVATVAETTVTSVATPVVDNVITPAVASVAENAADVIEEIFDFEEIFKVLISELDQEVLNWDAQTS